MAREVFSWTEGFAAYGFSAAHAASFAELAYASAYMRTNFPAEYLAAVLNSQPMGFYSPRAILNEARRIGLSILPADVHLSGEGFTAEDSEAGAALRVGLKYARGLSRKALSSILAERSKAPFSSTLDLYRRTEVGRGALENLVKEASSTLSRLRGTPAGAPRCWRRLASCRRSPGPPRGGARTSCPSRTRRAAPGTEGRTSSSCGGRASCVSRPSGARRWSGSRSPSTSSATRSLRTAGRSAGSGSRRAGRSSSCPTAPGPGRPGSWNPCRGRPQRSGRPVYFLLIEDEAGLFQATIFEGVYRRDGHVLHQRGAFLLDGKVEQDERRGFSFLVERVRDLSRDWRPQEGCRSPGQLPPRVPSCGRSGGGGEQDSIYGGTRTNT